MPKRFRSRSRSRSSKPRGSQATSAASRLSRPVPYAFRKGSVVGRKVSSFPPFVGNASPMPNKYKCTLKYFDQANVSGTIGGSQVCNINSLFDPDNTGGGHQPAGFDQLAAFYYYYRVIACTVHASVTASDSNSRPIAMTILGTDDATAPASFVQAAEQPGASPVYYQAYTAEQKVLSYRFDMAALNGQTMAEFLGDDTTKAAVTASPSDLMFAKIVVAYADATASAFTCVINWTLEFECQFEDPRIVPLS